MKREDLFFAFISIFLLAATFLINRALDLSYGFSNMLYVFLITFFETLVLICLARMLKEYICFNEEGASKLLIPFTIFLIGLLSVIFFMSQKAIDTGKEYLSAYVSMLFFYNIGQIFVFVAIGKIIDFLFMKKIKRKITKEA